MASTNVMVQKCAGLIDTKDISAKENDFLKNVVRITDQGKHPERLSSPQLAWLMDIHARHFEG